jgi:class 3 adenylate cyclase
MELISARNDRAHNEAASRQRRIRLRAAIHAGEVHYDEYGVAGMAINMAFRLMDADTLKRTLRDSSHALALIASHWFYDEVIRHSPRCSPAAYRQVEVAVKETKATAWISLPGHPSRRR